MHSWGSVAGLLLKHYHSPVCNMHEHPSRPRRQNKDLGSSEAQLDLLMAMQEEASKLKYPTVKGFLKHVRKATQANKPM